MNKLKPCPFCGGKEIVVDGCKGLEDCAGFEECGHPGYVSVVCNVIKGGCGASSGYFAKPEQAMEAWNKRVDKWIPFLMEYNDEEKRYILQCQLPDDGQEILVTDEETVWQDIFLCDGEDCYLDGGGAFCDEVSAWRPLPEPYKGSAE